MKKKPAVIAAASGPTIAAGQAGPGSLLRARRNSTGVPWAGFHTFRHTCATMLFRRGLNAKQVQMWLGHHSPAFTLAAYVHLIPDDLPDAGVFLETPGGGNKGATRPEETRPDAGKAEDAETGIVPSLVASPLGT